MVLADRELEVSKWTEYGMMDAWRPGKGSDGLPWRGQTMFTEEVRLGFK